MTCRPCAIREAKALLNVALDALPHTCASAMKPEPASAPADNSPEARIARGLEPIRPAKSATPPNYSAQARLAAALRKIGAVPNPDYE